MESSDSFGPGCEQEICIFFKFAQMILILTFGNNWSHPTMLFQG